MTEPEIQNHIAILQRWLAAAWRRLGDPALTPFDKRELRNQMKEADLALRQCLALASELKSAQPGKGEADASHLRQARPAVPHLEFGPNRTLAE